MSWVYDNLPPLTHADPKVLARQVENSSDVLLVMTEKGDVFRAWYSNPRELWVRPNMGNVTTKIIAWWQEEEIDAPQND